MTALLHAHPTLLGLVLLGLILLLDSVLIISTTRR